MMFLGRLRETSRTSKKDEKRQQLHEILMLVADCVMR